VAYLNGSQNLTGESEENEENINTIKMVVAYFKTPKTFLQKLK
jgi:hypothetical protein